MASESKKPRVEESQEDSSMRMKTEKPEDRSEVIAKKDLYKLPIGKKIDFTIKSHLTDATFVIEGKKIHAGSEFLSLHSSYFKNLLKGGSFAEEEFELMDISYENFHEMLRCLSDQTRVAEDEHIESLLVLGDRFDIKCLVDRAESFLIKSEKISNLSKLLLADKYRLIKLEKVCRTTNSCHMSFTFQEYSSMTAIRMRNLTNSEEFAQLSESAKAAITTEVPWRPIYEDLTEVEKMEEPANGFIASGELPFDYEMNRCPANYDVAGLFWTVEKGWVQDTKDQFSLCLVVNQNRPSSVEWSVEGFVEVKMAMVSKTTLNENHEIEKKFAFSLSNSNRAGRMIIPADSKNYEKNRSTVHLAFVTIYVTKVSGIRRSPIFDFTVPSEFTDAAFILEGKKFHVNKQYLSTISPLFLKVFYNKNEVELKNMSHQELIEFLFWIYPSARRNLDVSSMFSVLKLAQGFNVKVDRCAVNDYLDCLLDFHVPARMIFFFEFNLGYLDSFRSYITRGWRDGDYARNLEPKLNNCSLIDRMRPVKMKAMNDFIVEYVREEIEDLVDFSELEGEAGGNWGLRFY